MTYPFQFLFAHLQTVLHPRSHFLSNFLHIIVLHKALFLKFFKFSHFFTIFSAHQSFGFPNFQLFRVHRKLFFFFTLQMKHSPCPFHRLYSLWVTSHFSISVSQFHSRHTITVFLRNLSPQHKVSKWSYTVILRDNFFQSWVCHRVNTDSSYCNIYHINFEILEFWNFDSPPLPNVADQSWSQHQKWPGPILITHTFIYLNN